VDIFDKIRRNRGELGQYQELADGYFMFPKLEGEIGPRMKFMGREVLNWSLNNYLGLANHPEVRKVDAEAAAQYGLAYPMGARMMSGQTTMHEKFESMAAEFVGKEAAYLLNYGYQGMVSIIDALVGRKDVIVYDSESHACIMDGLRMVFARRFVFPHNDMEGFEKQLEHAQKIVSETGGGILVITEGVFGMAGDLGALDKIVPFKKKYNFRLLVDDAHGIGTMGKTGAGTGEHFGVQKDIDVYFGTFAKSFVRNRRLRRRRQGCHQLPQVQPPFTDLCQGTADGDDTGSHQTAGADKGPSRTARKTVDHRKGTAERIQGGRL